MSILDQMYKILTDAKEHEKTTCDYITPKDLESWMDHITVQEHVMQHMRDYAEQQITKLSEALAESKKLNFQYCSQLAELEQLRKENELNKQTLEEIKKTEWELAGEATPVYLLAHYRLLGESEDTP